MSKPSTKLLQLIEKLDAMTGPPSLVNLAEAFGSVNLTLADVESYVETNLRNYNRALITLRERYELLVMTWLPGQESVPHDHSGSICVMQVLQGNAVESQFRIDRHGYVELDYECTVPCGEITAGEDAGVHAVRNPPEAPTPLVTLHAYSPPLKDFRRFIRRPAAPRRSAAIEESVPTVVVIGGGFSGSMTAAQILRCAQASETRVNVMLVERRGAVGEGVAYGTREAALLLNVPAGRMSAWPDQPDHFLNWAQARDHRVKATDFLPRMWYGQYVRETLLEAAEAYASYGDLQVVLTKFAESRVDLTMTGWFIWRAVNRSVRRRSYWPSGIVPPPTRLVNVGTDLAPALSLILGDRLL